VTIQKAVAAINSAATAAFNSAAMEVEIQQQRQLGSSVN